jgi:hypothetical protein
MRRARAKGMMPKLTLVVMRGASLESKTNFEWLAERPIFYTWLVVAGSDIIFFLFDTNEKVIHPASAIKMSIFYFTLSSFLLALPYGSVAIAVIYTCLYFLLSVILKLDLSPAPGHDFFSHTLQMAPGIFGIFVNYLFFLRYRPRQSNNCS